MAHERIVAVIPARDEEDSIAAVVRGLPPLLAETIVVDNASRDRTAEKAREAGARVVSEPRRGYGHACLAGIAAAGDADLIVFLDGDGSDDPTQLERVVAPIRQGRADLVIGSRALGRRTPGAHPWHAVLGTRLCVGLMNLLVGSRASDLGPFRAVKREALSRLRMRDPSYGWTAEMQVKAALAGLHVVEVPVDHRPRSGGRSKVSGTVRGTVGAATKIIGTILRYGLLPPSLPGPARAAAAERGERRRHPQGAVALLALSALTLTGCVLAWRFGPPPTERIARHLALYGLAFAAYLLALIAARGLSRRALLACLSLAVLWRAVLVTAVPLVSDDVNRYVWEGRIQNHGGNPYAWEDRPEASRWAPLRDAVWEGVNHKGYTAVYPPLFVLACRTVVTVSDSVTGMKAFLVGCEVLTLGLLVVLLRRRGLPRERLLVLAWSPFALVEIAGSGHNEAFGMAFLVLALLALEAQLPMVSALAAGAGFMSKFLPGLVAAAWARRYRLRDVLAAAALSAALVAPFLGAHRTLLLSLRKYAQFWTFNETLFDPLAMLLGHDAAVRVGVLATLLLAGVLALRRTEPVAAATAVVVASLLLTPNLLPWYALWLLPLLVLRDEPAALLFTGTGALAYLVYPTWQSGERWAIGWGWRALEYAPCLLVAVWSFGERAARLRRGVRGRAV
jgi:hypothetical protein